MGMMSTEWVRVSSEVWFVCTYIRSEVTVEEGEKWEERSNQTITIIYIIASYYYDWVVNSV